MKLNSFLMVGLMVFCSAFAEHPIEDEDEERPYHFAYSASRYYNGHPDREHQEEKGEDGVTRGVYRYVDPRLEIQEVVYRSDDDGFHVQATNLPRNTPVVERARLQHMKLFQEIKKRHELIAKEREMQKQEDNE